VTELLTSFLDLKRTGTSTVEVVGKELRARSHLHGEATRQKREVLIACNAAALTAEQRERQWALIELLRADAKEVRELEDGYAFGHSPDRATLLAIAEFVANERLCCPFFEFGITVERDGRTVWLRITGEGEAKRVLEAEMGVGA
jgi:hypothetical protein